MSNTKVCTKCGAEKALTEFYKHKSQKDGLRSQCKTCIKAACAKYKENNNEAILKRGAEYRKENRDLIAAKRALRREMYADEIAEYQSEWKRNNRDRCNALNAKRRAQKLNATPSWADLGAIKDLYTEAQRLQDITGIEFHIDHVIPLQGELVCGLHVETNLQIIPAPLNVRKSNKFEV